MYVLFVGVVVMCGGVLGDDGGVFLLLVVCVQMHGDYCAYPLYIYIHHAYYTHTHQYTHSYTHHKHPHTPQTLPLSYTQKMASTEGGLKLTHFQRIKQLGSGDVGMVDLVKLRDTDHVFAMKTLDKREMVERNKVGVSGVLGGLQKWVGCFCWVFLLYTLLHTCYYHHAQQHLFPTPTRCTAC